jgi:hypothetical protein
VVLGVTGLHLCNLIICIFWGQLKVEKYFDGEIGKNGREGKDDYIGIQEVIKGLNHGRKE